MKKSYKWAIGVLDTQSNEKVIDVKGLTLDELELVIQELKMKFR